MDHMLGMYPEDDGLTSLQWLANFSFPGPNQERPSGPGCPSSQQQLLEKSIGNTASRINVPSIARFPITATEVEYKTNPNAKPPHTYATLICMAMRASMKEKISVANIYSWIKDNFCYYKHAKPSWQNSIRHTLSLNKCFKKVPREKEEPGKGGFWQMDPEHSDMLDNGIFRRRKLPENHYRTLLRKKLFNGTASTTSSFPVAKDLSSQKKAPPSADNGRANISKETPLDFNIVAAALDKFLVENGILEDLDLTTNDKTLESDVEWIQHSPREPEEPVVFLEEVEDVQAWMDIMATENVTPTLDQGLGLSGFFMTPYDHTITTTPTSTLTVL